MKIRIFKGWRILVILGVVIACLLILIWPDKQANTEKVDPRIVSASRQIREIDVYFYLDGMNSCGFRIIDRSEGEIIISIMRPNADRRVFIGSISNPEGSIEIEDKEENILFLLKLLREHSKNDKRSDIAISYISGSLKDKIKILAKEIIYRDYILE